ncbi:MAG: tRNA (guanosine(37)-N1)-methyltransferase TrmD [Acidimicrobiales bacterium]|nr:tRNA (guanosine(37)-N1)-methyltransferase TrmD [Acidimicrobiales bacterium]MDG1846803.1 tRNA (guanosine(37)-N1)-methyltransferase TrmD [Acidimicrobiales bacterium]
MRVDVFTIFPALVDTYTSVSLLGKARENKLLDLRCHDIREGATGRHRSVDDSPFGGGAGMVLKPEPIFKVVESVAPPRPLILMSPSGKRFDQVDANALAELDGFSLLCGRYEGIDQRIIDHLVDREISIGDFVVSGGEIAALTIIEAVIRLLPGVMGNEESSVSESFSDGLLEYPHYTRPREFQGHIVPEELISGNHDSIARWRKAKSLRTTIKNRPDLIADRGGLSEEEQKLLESFPEGELGD